MSFFREVHAVAWSDIRFMRHNILKIALSSLMLPILYLLAFGYGLKAGDVDIFGDGSQMVPYLDFVIPGIIALTSLSSSFNSTATRMNVQRLYYRSFDEMMMCPLSNSAIIVGKTMLGMARSIISCTLMFCIGKALEPDFIHLTPLFVISVLLCCFMFALLGETAALMVKSHSGMSVFTSLVITPMTFLCGTFFSAESLPTVVQGILYIFPLTEASMCIRAASLDLYAFPFWALGVIIAYIVVFFAIDMYLIKNRKV
ncbi:MAG: ABC transporter permease [Candidatus Methanomethylophilaceae archaeon]|nr:ABC transporter permease [Candidatus Methanomethylophilaceae archaeon]